MGIGAQDPASWEQPGAHVSAGAHGSAGARAWEQARTAHHRSLDPLQDSSHGLHRALQRGGIRSAKCRDLGGNMLR